MHIEFSKEVALQLETLTVQTNGLEFSGLGFVEWDKASQTFYVYDFVPLDVGSTGWTEIPSEKLLPLYERSDVGNLKIWIHRHPVGDGIPGRHNWSGTDTRTCRYEPLGVPYGMQDSVKWSLAAVRTPYGWVGRYDTYGPKGKTAHLRVVPSLAQEIAPWVNEIRAVKAEAARVAEATRRADTVHQLRRLVPFVEWGKKPHSFRRSYSTRRTPPFGSEAEEEQFYEDWEEYLAEQEGSRENVSEEDELAHFVQQYFWGMED